MRKMFSKNQIEEMIQNAIKSGATKLYLHTITINFPDDYSGSLVAPFYVISVRKEPLDNDELNYFAINDGSLINAIDDDLTSSIYSIEITNDGHDDLISIKCADSTFNLENEPVDYFQDVVTSL